MLWEPVGVWDADGSDLVAAVFGSRIVWDVLHRDRDTENFQCLYWALALIADNGGRPVKLKTNRPRAFPFPVWNLKVIEHLARSEWVTLTKAGNVWEIAAGKRTEALRASYREEWSERLRSEKAEPRRAALAS